MSFCRSSVSFLLCALMGHLAAAQGPEGPEGPFVPEVEEPTLPEVVVRPSEAPAPSARPASPYELPLSYPDLSDTEFEGLGSALRSTRSIFDDPRHATVIDTRDLGERNARDMHEALEREVGVMVQRTGASHASPFIRGLTGPQTLILVDGVRLNNSTFRFGPNQYFASIDPGMIDRIEVVRGPQSVLWGSDAIGGVINIVTRSPERGLGNFTGGEFTERFNTADSGSYSRLNVEGWINRWGAFGGASYLNIRDLDRGGGLGRQEMTNYSQYAGDIKLDYALDDNQLLTVSLQHLEQEDVPRTDKWYSPGDRKELCIFDPQQRNLAYIRWQGADLGGVFDAFMFTASFGRQKEGTLAHRLSRSYFNLQEFEVETTGINLVLANELGFLGRLTYGVDWYHDEVDAANNRFDFATSALIQTDTPQFPNDSYYERAGVFLQWDVDVTDRLYAVAGVRYTDIDLGSTVAMFDPTDPNFPNVVPVPTPIHPNFQDWTGSVGLTYELNQCLHLVGSVSEGFRAPGLDELTSVSGNVGEGVDLPTSGLTPETSYNYELGLKLDYDRIRAQAFVFWSELEGLTDRVLVFHDPAEDIDYFQRKNVGQAEVQGVELAGEVLLTPRWSTYGNLTHTYGQNLTDDEPLSRIPPTQGVIGLRWRDRQARNFFDLYAWLVARQDRLSSRDERDTVRIPPGGTPGYGTVNVRLGSYITRNQRITLGIENIFDRYYRVHGSGVDGPGISGNFGYELFY